jgi:hypothetical protein
MQKSKWWAAAFAAVLIRGMALNAGAQEGRVPVGAQPAVQSSAYRTERGLSGFQMQLEKAVGMSPEQRDAVRGLLAQQRSDTKAVREATEAKIAAIRTQTDAKIRALLNQEQQKKFDTFLSKKKQSNGAKRNRAS